ncbi:hypothetical protein CLOM_g9531 [Closterium sp. NIES-68]|nr:hypothetical protein CLOM_g9531 [Closterium sp. NIES-68]GJP65602.1 hypothetical protein CLOP_g22474 [Closterium sp. NIES-67]GJP66744.1 hypothetical protein CLOP_g23653 [Closterium sp. NIES-67]
MSHHRLSPPRADPIHDPSVSPRTPRVLLVGNLCHDVITLKSGKTVEALGGSVAYISRVLDAVGMSSRSVAKVGSDFKYWDALGPNCRPVLVEGNESERGGSNGGGSVAAKTTEFFADFTGSDRVLTAGHVCEAIGAADLPSFPCSCSCPCGCQSEHSLGNPLPNSRPDSSTPADAAAIPAAEDCDNKRCDSSSPGGDCSGGSCSHMPMFDVGVAAGVAGEVQPSTVRHIAEISRHTVADLQSMVRHIDPVTGAVELQHLEKTAFMGLIPRISFLKVASHEAAFLDIERCARLLGTAQATSAVGQCNGSRADAIGGAVLLTRAEKGCTVVTRDREFVVPSFPAVELDSTGAGDSFMAGFIIGLCLNRSLEEAVQMGSFFGGVAVEQVGVPIITPQIGSRWQATFNV